MITVTDSNFEVDVLRAELPVLLVVWAPSCTPCAELDRTLEQLAPALAGKVLLAKANAAQCRSLPTRLGVLFLPTVILFIGGSEARRLPGVPTSTEVQELVRVGDEGRRPTARGYL